mgnify:CR=1 FL=1
MNTVKQQWEDFADAVIPKDAPAIQVTEMRKAFYAGVTSMLSTQLLIGGESVSMEEGASMLERVRKECCRFSEEMDEEANGSI